MVMNPARFISIAVCFLSCAVGPSAGAAANEKNKLATPTAAQISATVESGMKQYGMVGAAVIVLKDGVPIFTEGFGSADLEHEVPVSPHTLFQSGSIGKMFTAAGIVLLAQEGKLSLDDTLSKYFPTGPDYWKRATLRDVMRHRAGVPNPDYDENAPSRRLNLKQDVSAEQIASAIAQWPMDFEPGTRYHYSNAGYILLGFIINQVSGQFYGDYLRAHLFQPLGMNTARVNEPREIIPDRAQSYVTEDGKLVHVDYVARAFNQTADGSLLFTVNDLAKWDAALRAADAGTGIFPKSQLPEIFSGPSYPDGTIGVTNYGYGWETRNQRGHRMIEHGGYWQGFSTYLGRYVDSGITVAMLTNTRNAKVQHVAMSVGELFDPEFGPFKPIADDNPALTQRLKAVARDYLTGKVDRAQFGKEAAARITPAQAARVITEVDVDRDAQFVLADRRAVGEITRYTYRWGTSRDATFTVTFDLRADHKIVDIVFQPV